MYFVGDWVSGMKRRIYTCICKLRHLFSTIKLCICSQEAFDRIEISCWHCVNAAVFQKYTYVVLLPPKCSYVSNQSVELSIHRVCEWVSDNETWTGTEIKLRLPLVSLSHIKHMPCKAIYTANLFPHNPYSLLRWMKQHKFGDCVQQSHIQ